MSAYKVVRMDGRDGSVPTMHLVGGIRYKKIQALKAGASEKESEWWWTKLYAALIPNGEIMNG